MADYVTAKGLTRTNKWADSGNAIKLKGIDRIGGYFVTGFSTAITAEGDTTTITPSAGHQNPVPEYYKFLITDHSGNEAYGSLDTGNPTNPVVIDTSALNAQESWQIIFDAKRQESDGDTKIVYPVIIAYPAANPTLAVSY